jgi:hypothetical protein
MTDLLHLSFHVSFRSICYHDGRMRRYMQVLFGKLILRRSIDKENLQVNVNLLSAGTHGIGVML